MPWLDEDEVKPATVHPGRAPNGPVRGKGSPAESMSSLLFSRTGAVGLRKGFGGDYCGRADRRRAPAVDAFLNAVHERYGVGFGRYEVRCGGPKGLTALANNRDVAGLESVRAEPADASTAGSSPAKPSRHGKSQSGVSPEDIVIPSGTRMICVPRFLAIEAEPRPNQREERREERSAGARRRTAPIDDRPRYLRSDANRLLAKLPVDLNLASRLLAARLDPHGADGTWRAFFESMGGSALSRLTGVHPRAARAQVLHVLSGRRADGTSPADSESPQASAEADGELRAPDHAAVPPVQDVPPSRRLPSGPAALFAARHYEQSDRDARAVLRHARALVYGETRAGELFSRANDRFTNEDLSLEVGIDGHVSTSDPVPTDLDLAAWALAIVRSRTFNALSGGAVIPVLDMINHAPSATSANVILDARDPDRVCVTTTRRVHVGEELLWSYYTAPDGGTRAAALAAAAERGRGESPAVGADQFWTWTTYGFISAESDGNVAYVEAPELPSAGGGSSSRGDRERALAAVRIAARGVRGGAVPLRVYTGPRALVEVFTYFVAYYSRGSRDEVSAAVRCAVEWPEICADRSVSEDTARAAIDATYDVVKREIARIATASSRCVYAADGLYRDGRFFAGESECRARFNGAVSRDAIAVDDARELLASMRRVLESSLLTFPAASAQEAG